MSGRILRWQLTGLPLKEVSYRKGKFESDAKTKMPHQV